MVRERGLGASLVFYNYILKCFVLIDLKTTKITHQDVGQMDMYVRMYDDLKRAEGDNPTLGIVLCAETDADIARYSVLHGNEQLFAAKYELYLPTEEQLRAEIEAQKAVFEAQQSESNDDRHEGTGLGELYPLADRQRLVRRSCCMRWFNQWMFDVNYAAFVES